MAIVDKAPLAAPLELLDETPQYFKLSDGETPVVVTLPGNSSFDLSLFNVTVTGTVNAAVPGHLALILFGKAKHSEVLTPLASSVPEPIGGVSELDETMWMIRGVDLMVFSGSGKMQGLFTSNVASHPQAPVDLEHHPGDITASDPLFIFGCGASFTPSVDRSGGKKERAVGAAPCTVKLASLTIDG